MGMQKISKESTAGAGKNTYDREDVVVIACSILALYNSSELLILIFMTFKRYKGLYFWSIFLASLGILPYCIGWFVAYFTLTSLWVGMILAQIGWTLLVSGQSMVLYSRLHLVLDDPKILRILLWIIILNGIIWHISITVLVFGSSYSPAQSRAGFNCVFNVLEKVQMSCFCLQEFALSGLYIWQARGILKTALSSQQRLIRQLFAINVYIMAMDVALLAIEYKSLFLWEQGVKVVTYSLKLKLEFAILGQLIEFVRHRGGGADSGGQSNHATATFIRLSSRRSQMKERESRFAATRPEPVHMEDVKPSASATATTSKASARPSQGQDEIGISTRMDMVKQPIASLE
ncbi:hypothetical protein BKA60DRAFT_642669 [Fusarium oxysporum]|nr:hypothetical protein BKA60DRAFT_642669 [Fusarium oxysporum]